MTQDQERRVKSLSRELEGWREVLVGLNSILVWDKQYYPAISISFTSLLFLFIWYVEPSMLTLFSILGIIITLADFLVPQVVPWVCGAHFWTGAHERRYEEIIKAIANIFGIYTCITTTLTTMKTNKPRTYFVSVTGLLIICAWIGNTVNNLLLTYIIVLVVVLFPGLKATGILHKYFASTISTVAGFIKGQLGTSEDAAQTKKKE